MKSTSHPNTYTLSKALAEEVAYSYRSKVPIVVIRPSLIWFADKEPFAGYVSGRHSGVGIVCGTMTGLIRSMYFINESVPNITPVDYAINATIASVWRRSLAPRDEVLFYNCVSLPDHQIRWKEMFEIGIKYRSDYAPYKNLFWYPNLSPTSSYTWHMISLFLFQLIPAMFVDLLQLLRGEKTM